MGAPRPSAERRLVAVIGAVVFVDTMFYAAIAPLLPSLAHELRLSKLSAGVMTAGYPVGTLVAALPGGVLAVRAGPKRTVYTGLVLLAGSTLAFGLLDSAPWLDAARFVEGVGGACSWAGGLAWIVAEAPSGRRGGLLGTALAAGIGGALFGPVIGTVAGAIGRAPTFSAVVVIVIGLTAACRGVPLTHTPSGQGMRDLGSALRGRAVQAGMWLVGLPAVVSGLLNVLGPLRLHRFGVGVVAIGATFLAAAAIEAAVSPAVGRLSDRRGRIGPVRVGLVAVGGLIGVFTLASGGWALAILIVATATALGAFWAPAMAMLSEAADAHRLDQGLAAALMNLAWAGGQILGSAAGGAAAKAAGDGVPTAAAAALCLLTLLAVTLSRRAAEG